MLREAQAPGAGLIHPTLKQASGIVEARKNNRDLNTNLIPEKRQRLIDWHVDQLHQLLLLITARRKQLKKCGIKPKRQGVIPQATVAQAEVTVFEEVKEVIEMPAAHPKLGSPDTSSAKLDDNVLWQLNDWVTSISTLYKVSARVGFIRMINPLPLTPCSFTRITLFIASSMPLTLLFP